MKNLNNLMIAAWIGLLLMTGTACNNSESAIFQEVDLKKNEELRAKVFQQILNDEELFTDFISKMREERQAMLWLRKNQPMMQDFYGRRQLWDMMRENPEMRQNMVQNLMQMMERDTSFMPRTPQMSQEMMRNMLRMMERDTNRMNPEIREQMLEHMRKMMVRDTMMHNRMRQMMQGNHTMRNN